MNSTIIKNLAACLLGLLATTALTFAADAAEMKAMHIKSLKVVGATVLDTADIQTLRVRFEGLDADPDILRRLQEAVIKLYENKGYMAPVAMLPVTTEEGTLAVSLRETEVDEVAFDGTVTDRRGLLDDLVAQLRREHPLTKETYEEVVRIFERFANLGPGRVAFIFEQGKSPQAVRLKIVERPQGMVGGAVTGNYDAEPTAKNVQTAAVLRNAAGFGETLVAQVAYGPSNQQKSGMASFSIPVTSGGLTATISAGMAESRPGYDQDITRLLDLRSTGSWVQAGLTAPIYLDLQNAFDASATVKKAHSKTRWLDGEPLYREETTSGTLGITYDRRSQDGQHRAGVSASLTGGVASGDARGKGATRYSKLNMGVDGRLPLPVGDLELVGKAGLQYARDRLPVSEMASCGGGLNDCARGVPAANNLAGDQTVTSSIELQRPVRFEAPVVGNAAVVPYVAVDGVWTHKVDGMAGEVKVSSAITSGGGIRLQLGENVAGEVGAFTQVNARPEPAEWETRVMASLTFRF